MRFLRAPRVLLAVCCAVAVAAGAVIGADRSASSMRTAAAAFLASLTPEQRQEATFDFQSAERTRWNFIPPQAFARKGLTFRAMNEAQREKAHALLKTGLSQRGYMTAASIMELESTLGGIERAARGAGFNAENFPREPLEYYVSIFGAPAKKGLRILAHEEDPARALVMALDATQREKAVIQNVAPNDILTGNKVEISPLAPAGIAAADLNASQRQMLMQVVEGYTSAMAADIAADRTSRLTKAGVEKIAFAWAGEFERGKKHYYRVQGPTFLIEFDNTQNNGNHIHSVWRDFNGDLGRDLLREHLKNVA